MARINFSFGTYLCSSSLRPLSAEHRRLPAQGTASETLRAVLPAKDEGRTGWAAPVSVTVTTPAWDRGRRLQDALHLAHGPYHVGMVPLTTGFGAAVEQGATCGGDTRLPRGVAVCLWTPVTVL